MAYPFFGDSQSENTPFSQYYSGYDLAPAYNSPEFTHSYPSPLRTSKRDKNMPSVNIVNERKCPIYVHKFNKTPNVNFYNKFASGNTESKPSEKHSCKTNNQNSKLMLDKLEETYWASWKPNKETNKLKSSPKSINKYASYENKAQGDVAETLIKYFATTDFNTSAASVAEEINSEYYKLTEIATNTREIQTDEFCPVILPKIEENEESDNAENSYPSSGSLNSFKAKQEVLQDDTAISGSATENVNETKIMSHTDSLIINKKKQTEPKEDFKKPKCIKLYKKTGSNFMKGGSYPLKSCLRSEPATKGNFRLGTPGSSLFITAGSFNKKLTR